ncbi:CASP-like protein 4A3, partial [Tanacetum coccineum]
MSWGWRKVLQIRPLVRVYIGYSIGDGARASLWFDKWCNLGPLVVFIPPRDMYSAGLNALSTVSDVFYNGVWNWPLYLCDKYLQLQELPCPSMNLDSDLLEWRNEDGVVKPFSVSMVWSSIRPRNIKVDWFAVVWFPYYIPRHAFNLWLVIKQRLKTQDKVVVWEVS